MEIQLAMHRSTFVILMLMCLVEGTDYLVALPHTSFKSSTPYVRARTDETGGTLYCEYPNFEWRRYVFIEPWDYGNVYVHQRMGTFSQIEHKAILIACSNSDASVEVIGGYFSFSPLPTTALGTKYTVSSCRQSRYYSLLVIAAYNLTTTVSIKARSQIFGPSFNRENIQKFELKPFQTFTLKYYSDLTGTVITSTQPIAVFSGMGNSTFLTAYEQLLPVGLYDKKYVVAVDDNPALYHLQIISEQKDTVITFNNGSSLTVNINLYQAQLRSQERFYFQSSNPVMVTICRRNGTQSGFIVISSVPLYSLRVVHLYGDSAIFMTQKETFINSSDIRWTHIPNSGYKTGVLARGSITTKAYGCYQMFSSSSIRTVGVTFSLNKRIEETKSYLFSVLKNINSLHGFTNQVISQLSSSQAASYQVVSPHRNQTYTRQMTAMSSDNFYIDNEMTSQTGVENKAIRIDVDAEKTQLIIRGLSRYGYTTWLSTIFPTTLLGQEYIVQTCYGNRPSESKLIIVSSSMNTDINVLLSHSITYDGVEYRPGDTIREHLQPYHTLTINSSVALCGTTVSASHNVAVFTYNKFGELSPDYNQLLPVEEFGQDYIVTASDQGNVGYNNDFENPISESSKYYILVTSATNLTQVQFSDNLQVTVAKGVSYHTKLHKNESLRFSSTKPVMVSLCSDVSAVYEREELHQSRCTVIVPTILYTSESRFSVTRSTIIKILTKHIDAEITLMWSDTNHFNIYVDITWETYPEFKIGTTTVAAGQVLISSTDKFTTICFNRNDQYSLFSSDSLFGDILNPMGWNHDIGNLKDRYVSTTASKISDISPTADVSSQDSQVNITAIAVGTSLSVLIIVLLAVFICQQINKGRNTRPKGEKTNRSTEGKAASFNQGQQQHRQGVSAVSTPADIYSDLHTGPQATNTYESINPSFAADEEVEYENVESKF